MRPSEQVQLSPDQMELTKDEYETHISEAYTKAFTTPNRTLTNNTISSQGYSSLRVWKSVSDEKGATALVRLSGVLDTSTLPNLEDWLLEKFEILPGELQNLASARARNIKDYLVQTGKVEAERITYVESIQSSKAKGNRMYLRLQ